MARSATIKALRLRYIILIAVSFVLFQVVAQDQYSLEKMSSLVRSVAYSVDLGSQCVSKSIPTQYINAFVKASNGNIDSLFKAHGCTVYDQRGDIYIVSIPTKELYFLASNSAISRIEASKLCSLDMDTTSILVDALPVYSGKSLPQAFTGRGVVVGVMDVGFDLTHPNFYNNDITKYRIGAIWDQLDPDSIGKGFPVGRDYVGEGAILTKQHSYDGLIQTHGTHTLGIAAGSGFDSAYRGMAYESDICLVSNAVSSDTVLIASDDIYRYTTAVDALGFKYIFDFADSLNQPCVASFSEGYYPDWDTEDSLFSAYLEAITGPGRIIVASAGNESVNKGFISKPYGVSEAGAFIVSSSKTASLCIETNAPLDIIFYAYDSSIDSLTVSTTDCLCDTITDFLLSCTSSFDSCFISIETYPSTFTFGDTIYMVSLSCSKSITKMPSLAIVLRGAEAVSSARVTSSAYFLNGVADERWNNAETSHNIHAPACFPSVIAVGATIHRTGFTNYLGTYYDYSQSGRNDGVRSYYSSIGPGAYGEIKPNVMAPGDNVVSSYSSYYLENNPNASDIRSDVEHFLFNSRTYVWNSNTGTSMACPIVAGAIALWLEAKPDLTREDIMTAIAKTSRAPEDDLYYPNNYYGYGEIDVYRGLLSVLGLESVEDLSQDSPQYLRIGYDGCGNLLLQCTLNETSNVCISLFNLAGMIVWHSPLITVSGSETKVKLPQLSSNIYAVQVTSNNKGFTGSSLIRL